MQFDTDNKIVRLCAEGMDMEGKGHPEAAGRLFLQAWNRAATHFEKLIAAHYVARRQSTVAAKLEWDKKALESALLLGDEGRAFLPSLYLNIAKCYEDLQQPDKAMQHYGLAQSFAHF